LLISKTIFYLHQKGQIYFNKNMYVCMYILFETTTMYNIRSLSNKKKGLK